MDTVPLIERIKGILPSFDSLPDLLDTIQTEELIGLSRGTLQTDRAGRRTFDIGHIKVGRLVKYPKLEIGKWLVKNAVGVGTGEE